MNWRATLFSTIIISVCTVGFFAYRSSEPKSSIVILGEDSSNLTAYRTVAEEFKATYGIEVKFEPVTFEQLEQRADADFRSKNGNYDVILNYNFSLAPYVRSGFVLGFAGKNAPAALRSPRVVDNFFEGTLKETSFYYDPPTDTNSSPKQFGFPFAANTMLLVYRKDLFESEPIRDKFRQKYGRNLTVPKDWKNYLDTAEFFSNLDGDLGGVVMQGAADGWLYYEFANYFFGIGTGTSDKKSGWEESPINLVTKENEEALRYSKKLLTYNAGDFFTVDALQQRKLMLDGRAAMAIMWSDYIPELVNQSSKQKKIEFGFSTVPGEKSGLAGGAFYINSNSRNPDASAQFILYVLSEDVQKKLITQGLCSPVRSAYTPEIRKTVPYADALYESLDRGSFMFEAGTDATITSNAITTFVQRYMRGEISEHKALVLAEQEIKAKRNLLN